MEIRTQKCAYGGCYVNVRRYFLNSMAAFKGDSIFWIETHKIVPNPFQPRREFDEQKLKELSESIRMYGVLQPLTVTRIEINDESGAFKTQYELIAGERRLRASKLAGVEQVPVIIREGEDSEQEKLELAIIENLQREDLNAVDRALAFRQLADVFELSHAQVAKKVGRSREYVSNSIRLLNLPDYMLESVKTADITEGHARTLLMLNDRPEEQDTLYREILLKKLTVREVERIARKIATDKVRKQTWKGTDPELIEKEKMFTESLGTRVQLTRTDYGGKITIDYFSDEDLDALIAQLTKEQAAHQSADMGAPAAQEVPATPAETERHKAAAQATEFDYLREATPLEMTETPSDPAGMDTERDTTAADAEDQAQTTTVATNHEAAVPPPAATSTPKPAASPLRAKLAGLFGEAAVATPEVVQPEAVTTAPETGAEPREAASATTDATTESDKKDDSLYDLKNFSI